MRIGQKIPSMINNKLPQQEKRRKENRIKSKSKAKHRQER